MGIVGRNGKQPYLLLNGNLEASGSSMEGAVGNVLLRVVYNGSDSVDMTIGPLTVPLMIDYKRLSFWDALGIESVVGNGVTLSTTISVDGLIFSSSRETHYVWLRQQDPVTLLWSLFEIHLFSSDTKRRTTASVYLIEENVSY